MIGETPGKLVESEIVTNLNDPCEIADPSWIKPGISAWDHWWSGEVKMEQPVIYEYIDLASKMGWPYMLIDWQWYGQFNQKDADIKKPAPQLNMPEILAYAKSKNVRCWLWLYNTDVDRFNFEEACALYEKWGIAGIKIDFMDIVQAAGRHRHGGNDGRCRGPGQRQGQGHPGPGVRGQVQADRAVRPEGGGQAGRQARPEAWHRRVGRPRARWRSRHPTQGGCRTISGLTATGRSARCPRVPSGPSPSWTAAPGTPTLMVTIDDAYLPAASLTAANVTATAAGGVITGFTIVDGGAGYMAPVVTITDAARHRRARRRDHRRPAHGRHPQVR